MANNDTSITPANTITPEDIAFMDRVRSQKECAWCHGPMDTKAQSFFTWELICAPCWYKELEVQRKLKKKVKNIKEYENIGYVPQV